ncbi:hypothetical protein PRIC1_000020 [Phytophthora ramorum]|nr:hypothetical protein KRP22_13455 [Phytophthora ramorum]
MPRQLLLIRQVIVPDLVLFGLFSDELGEQDLLEYCNKNKQIRAFIQGDTLAVTMIDDSNARPDCERST